MNMLGYLLCIFHILHYFCLVCDDYIFVVFYFILYVVVAVDQVIFRFFFWSVFFWFFNESFIFCSLLFITLFFLLHYPLYLLGGNVPVNEWTDGRLWRGRWWMHRQPACRPTMSARSLVPMSLQRLGPLFENLNVTIIPTLYIICFVLG